MQRIRLARAAMMLALAFTLPATLSLAACGKKKDPKDTAPRVALTVSVAPAQQTLLPRAVDASGTITAWQEVAVGAETGGLTAVEVLADEGSWVRQGQLLVRMDTTLLQAQVQQAEAGVKSAKATLVQANADWQRSVELNQRGYLAKAALDQKQAAQGTAAANLANAEASLAAARARLKQAFVRAPVSGLITARKVVKGQIVTAGAELFTLVRDGRLELAAQVPETQLALLRPGMGAVVSSDQVGQASGRVRVITPEVDPQTRVGLARIALSAPGGFRPGMFANGQVNVGALPALTVPSGAVLYRDNKPGLFVIDGQGVAHYRQVTTGARTGELMEITSGVAAGDRVATDGAGFLAEGDHVRVVNQPGAR